MKQHLTMLAAATLLIAAASVLALAADSAGSPCAGVKDGSIAFKDSPSCIKECAEDGGDCPYNARPVRPQPDTPPANTTAPGEPAGPNGNGTSPEDDKDKR